MFEIKNDTSFDDALEIIAKQQVKQEYAEGYLNMFKQESAYELKNAFTVYYRLEKCNAFVELQYYKIGKEG